MDISRIISLCKDDTIEMTSHVWLRCQQRDISYRQIKEAIVSSEILEEYIDDYPYPSCLMLGKAKDGTVLHIVVGEGDGKLWIITVYKPSLEKWSEDYRTRRKKYDE